MNRCKERENDRDGDHQITGRDREVLKQSVSHGLWLPSGHQHPQSYIYICMCDTRHEYYYALFNLFSNDHFKYLKAVDDVGVACAVRMCVTEWKWNHWFTILSNVNRVRIRFRWKIIQRLAGLWFWPWRQIMEAVNSLCSTSKRMPKWLVVAPRPKKIQSISTHMCCCWYGWRG